MADVAYSELEHLRNRAHTLCSGLSQRFEEIYTFDFPTPTPQKLIQLLQNILLEFSEEINKATDAKFLILISQLIEFYGSFLQFLDNANTEQTPRGLVHILEDIIHKLDPDAELLAWPQAEYNYSIIDIIGPIKDATENIFSAETHTNIFKPFKGPLKLISFPRIERDDILVHAIFGHEIGHPIADDFLSNEELKSPFLDGLTEARKKLVKKYEKQISTLPSDVEKVNYTQELLSQLITVRKRGLEELISDCVALLVFGPSALFASYDVLVLSGLDVPPSYPDYYPPSRYRLRVIKELMDKEGFTETLLDFKAPDVDNEEEKSLKGFLDNIDIIIGDYSDQSEININPILEIAYDWLKDTLSEAIDFAKKQVADVTYSKDIIQKEIPDLLERLELDLPPNEIGVYPKVEIVDWKSAILSAWIFKIVGSKKTSKGRLPIDIKDIERLQRRTLKAIEYIMLQKKYNEHMST